MSFLNTNQTSLFSSLSQSLSSPSTVCLSESWEGCKWENKHSGFERLTGKKERTSGQTMNTFPQAHGGTEECNSIGWYVQGINNSPWQNPTLNSALIINTVQYFYRFFLFIFKYFCCISTDDRYMYTAGNTILWLISLVHQPVKYVVLVYRLRESKRCNI